MTITPATRVADLAAARPATIRIFQRHAIDFCCGGKRPLQEVCEERGIAFETLAAELNDAWSPASPDRLSWNDRKLSDLTGHIIEAFHDPLRSELPRLIAMAHKVDERHGRTSEPNAAAIAATLERFRDAIEPHAREEEDDVFPLIEYLEDGTADRAGAVAFLAAQDELEAEHEEAARLLETLRALSNGYQPADGVCPTTLGLYHGLGDLEALMHLHVHLENNVLFPRAAALARQLTEARFS